MEYLDIYDENENYLGKEKRDIVHKNALWHNTVHCWLYDKYSNVYFQIRKEEKQLYTTASGHIKSGESIKEGFGREIKEEIGINLDITKSKLIDKHKYKMDLIKKDGTIFKDRAFVNLYAFDFEGNISDFKFDENEVDGLAKVNAKDAKKLFNEEIDEINCSIIKSINGRNVESAEKVSRDNFLLCKGEKLIEKYGLILDKVIELTK